METFKIFYKNYNLCAGQALLHGPVSEIGE